LERRWISVREAAEYLSLHEVTIRRKIDKEELPAARLGHVVRVDLKALNEQLERKMNLGGKKP